MAKQSISVSLISQFDPKGFMDAQKQAQGLSGEFKKLAGKAAGVFAAAKVADFARDAIDAASALGESANAVNVVYGDAAEGIRALGENAAETVGLSARSFNEFAVQFSSFATQIAGSSGDAVGVVDDLTTRAADFASVMNISVEEAASVFQSTMAGSSEVIRQYGVDVGAAAVETYLLNNGLVESKSAITEADKVLGRYALLMEGTEATAGDFVNTSDSLANQQRILAADFENMQAKIGEALLPAMQSLVTTMVELIDAAERFGIIDIVSDLADFGSKAERVGRQIRGLFDRDAAANWNFVEEVERAEEAFAVFDFTMLEGKGMDEVRQTVLDSLGPLEDMIDAQHLVNLVMIEQRQRIDEAVEAQERNYWAMRYGGQAAKNLAEDVEDASDELMEFATVWDREIARIKTEQDVVDIAEQFDDLRERAGEALEAAAEGAQDADEKLKYFEDGLRDAYLQALTLGQELGGLPDEVVTEIRQEFEDRDLDALEIRLNNLALGIIAPVKIKITAETAGISGYIGAAGQRQAEEAMVNAILGSLPQGATGGIVTKPTVAVIGERGPEAVVPLSSTPGSSPLPGGVGSTYNITVNAGVGDPGTIGKSVVEAIAAYERRNGSSWRAA